MVVIALVNPLSLLGQGELINGEVVQGSIDALFERDEWTFEAEAGDYIVLSTLKTDFDSSLSIYLNLRKPDNFYVRSSGSIILRPSHFKSGRLYHVAEESGTYVATISDEGARRWEGLGGYWLTLAKAPGEFTIPENDEGGPLIAGTNQVGTIDALDLDMWTFEAAEDDLLLLSITDVLEFEDDGGLGMNMTLIGPNGQLIDSISRWDDPFIERRAPVAGQYTVITGSSSLELQGDYHLQLLTIPGAIITPDEDEGGSLSNGAKHHGRLDWGDIDVWTFEAEKDDYFSFRLEGVADDPESNFLPLVSIYDKDGEEVYAWSPGPRSEIVRTAPNSGTYSAIVRNYRYEPRNEGDYTLEFFKVPGPWQIEEGDEGGDLTRRGTHSGTLTVDEVDLWSIEMAAGEHLFAIFTDESISDYFPQLRLFFPDGRSELFDQEEKAFDISIAAEQSGSYTFLIQGGERTRTEAFDYTLDVIAYRPNLVLPDSITIDEGQTVSIELRAESPLNGLEEIDFNIVSAPLGTELSIDDSGATWLNWTPPETLDATRRYLIVCELSEQFKGIDFSDTESIAIIVNKANSPPEIVQKTETIEFDQELQLEVEVKDVDLPANNLVVSFNEGPSGAHFNSETGIISWTPTIQDEGKLYAFHLSAVDDGEPSLDSSGVHFVYVKPLPIITEVNNYEELITVMGLSGYKHYLEVSTDLDGWVVLEEFTLNDDTPYEFDISDRAETGNFYRVRVESNTNVAP